MNLEALLRRGFFRTAIGREPLIDFGAVWPPEWPLLVGADVRARGVEKPPQEASALPLVAAVELESVYMTACEPLADSHRISALANS